MNREEDKLFFFSKEDLKNYFNVNYQIVPNEQTWKEDLELEDVFYNLNSLGIIVTRRVFEKANFKKELLKNLKRGSDYYVRNWITSGVWIIFFDFIVGDDYIKEAVELSGLVDDLTSKRFPKERILDKIMAYKNHRQILVALEEYRLLEEIDISNHMLNVINE